MHQSPGSASTPHIASDPHLYILLASVAEPGSLGDLDDGRAQAAHVIGVIAPITQEHALFGLALPTG